VKPAAPILVAAFGAMGGAAREAYALMEDDLRCACPGREIGWAYTAGSLVVRLRAQGEPARLLPEAYADLAARGVERAAVLSLHLVPGVQHLAVAATPAGLRTALAGPFLGCPADLDAAAQGLLADLPDDGPVLVVAHGNAQAPEGHRELDELGRRLRAVRPDLWLTRLEGEPDPDGLEAFIHRARRAGRAHLEPFLFVAGDHLKRDLLGDAPDSLKRRLDVPRFSCGTALGARRWVRRRFVAQVRAALARLEEA
jgi:sirohydrochlorin cobaltochelatase